MELRKKCACTCISLPGALVIKGFKIIGVHLQSEDKNFRT